MGKSLARELWFFLPESLSPPQLSMISHSFSNAEFSKKCNGPYRTLYSYLWMTTDCCCPFHAYSWATTSNSVHIPVFSLSKYFFETRLWSFNFFHSSRSICAFTNEEWDGAGQETFRTSMHPFNQRIFERFSWLIARLSVSKREGVQRHSILTRCNFSNFKYVSRTRARMSMQRDCRMSHEFCTDIR